MIRNRKVSCPICKSTSVFKKYKLYDDRYAYSGSFNLLECKECQHKFLDIEFSSEQLSELYSNYYPRATFDIESFNVHKELSGFSVWINGNQASTYRWIPKNVKVLDIGCGFGESLGYHQKRGCEVWGVEADKNILRVAQRYGFKVKAGLFDAQDYEKESFDYVTMDQVIEHVVDPVSTMKGIAKILKPGGVLVMSTPNSNGWGAKIFGRRWINWHAPYHVHHFSNESIRLMAEQADFEVQLIKTVTKSRWVNYQWIHCLYFPKEGENSMFWSYQKTNPSWSIKLVFRLFSIFHKTGIDHLVTRLFDSLGLGDNFLIVLHKKSDCLKA